MRIATQCDCGGQAKVYCTIRGAAQSCETKAEAEQETQTTEEIATVAA